MKINIGGIGIDRYSFEEVVRLIVTHAESRQPPAYVVTPNAQHIVLLQRDPLFRKIYQNALLSVPDGVPLLWAAKLLGTPLQGRVNGTDLFEQLCQHSAERGLSIFLLGGRPGAAQAAAQHLQTRHPKLNIAGTYCPPYGFEHSSQELDRIHRAVQSASPDLLFVGLGAPKQEKWIYQTYQQLQVPVSLGIGVSFELVAGVVQRAPRLMQKLGLEWLFRLFMEPRRLWKRYVIGNTTFVGLVIKQRLGWLKEVEPL